MSDMTRQELRLYASLLIASTLSLFMLLAWQTGQVNKQLSKRYEVEKTLVKITTGCKSDDTGAAVCEAGTFSVTPIIQDVKR